MKQDKAEAAVALLKPTLSYDDLEGRRPRDRGGVRGHRRQGSRCSEKLDEVCKPGAILASNTSTLDLNAIAAFTQRPQDVVGAHFFSPANVMKLLEIVRGAKTGNDVLATMMQLAKKIKKTAVVSGVCDGFIGNRMVAAYHARGVLPAGRGRIGAADRRRARDVRHGDGHLQDGRPRRRRHQLGDPQAQVRGGSGARANSRSPTGCARWGASARRPAAATTATSRAGATRCAIRWSTSIVDAYRKEAGITPRKIERRRDRASAASTRWSTKARASSRKASRSARRTSTSCTCSATAFRRSAAARCSTRTSMSLINVVRTMQRFAQNPHGRSGVLAAGAAARAARGRRQDVQRITRVSD